MRDLDPGKLPPLPILASAEYFVGVLVVKDLDLLWSAARSPVSKWDLFI